MKKIVSFTIILTLLFTCFACIPMQAAQPDIYVTPRVATASSQYANLGPELLYDGGINYDEQGWVSDPSLETTDPNNNQACWAMYEFEEPIRIEAVSIYFTDLNINSATDYTLQATNDVDGEWDLLAAKVNGRDIYERFPLHTDKAYKYLKLAVTAAIGSGHTRIREMLVEPVTGENEERVDDFSFADTNGNKIFTLPADSTVVAKAVMANNKTEGAFSAVMLVGVYDANGKLLKLATSNQVDCATNDVADLSATITTDTVDGTQQLRALVYQDTTNFKPLAPAAVLSSSAGSESFVWHFNERSGSKLTEADGKYTATLPTGALWAAGISGTGLYMPTATEPVKVDNFSGDLSGDFTISAYVKQPTTTSDFKMIVAKGPKDSGHFEVYLHNGYLGVWTPDMSGYADDATTPINDNQWHQVAVIKKGTDMMYYIDGTCIATYALSGSIAKETETLIIGGLADNGYIFDGKIDEVQIYNRALTEEEIKASMVFDNKLVTRLDMTQPLAVGDTTTGKEQYEIATVNATYDENEQAYAFNGASNYIDIANFDYNLKNSFTIAADVKFNVVQGFEALVAKGLYATDGLNALHFVCQNGEWLRLRDTVAWGDPYANVGSLIGSWHHVAVTYATDRITYYIDGVEKAYFTPSEYVNLTGGGIALNDTTLLYDAVGNIPTTLRIGASFASDGALMEPLNGYMKSVEIYDTALTAAEVAALAE